MGTRRINSVTASTTYDTPASSTPPTNTTSTNGIFVYNATRQGWEIPANVRDSRDLPNLIVVNASEQVISILDQMIAGSTAGAGTFLAYLNALTVPQLQRNENYNPQDPSSGPEFWPRETDTGGATFLLDIRMMTSTRGGYVTAFFSRPISEIAGGSGFGFDEIIRDSEETMPSGGTFLENRQYADARAVLNLLLPLQFGSSAAEQTFLQDHVREGATVIEYRGTKYFNLFDISDDFFRDRYGVVSAAAYFQINAEHELALHPGLNETSSGASAFEFGGHSQILSRLLQGNSGAALNLTQADIRADPVERRSFEQALARGHLTGDGSDYLRARVVAYDQKLDVIVAEIERVHGVRIRNVGDLQSAIGKGWFRDAEQRMGHTGVTVTISEPNGLQVVVEQFFDGASRSLTTFDGAQLGIALGSVLGKRITDNAFGQIAASAALKTLLGGFGEALDNGAHSTNILGNGIEGLFDNFGQNVIGGATGSVSSYLTAELVKAIGADGILGDALNSAGGGVVNQVLTNIVSGGVDTLSPSQVFQGVNPLLLANAIGSLVGSKLAAEVKTFESVGGQIGAAVGAAYGSWAAAQGIIALGVTNPFLAVAIVAVVVFVDTLIGGMIGSIFGGTPRSGADAAWDASKNEFVVANVYARKGGSKDVARSLAGAVAANFNAVLAASGATLLDPAAVQPGNYGMRKKDYVYRPAATQDKDAITARFEGKDGATQLIAHGTYLGLSGLLLQLAGGDVYVKRAVAASLANVNGNASSNANGAAGDFDLVTLMGDINVARDYETYIGNRELINSLIAAAPETAFSAGWLVTLTHALELGIHRRAFTDWVGGFQTFFDEVVDGIIDGVAVNAAQVEARIDVTIGARAWSVYDESNTLLGYSEDTIDATSLTRIKGTAESDTIILAADQLLATTGATNADLTINGVVHNGSALKIDVAAMIDAGEGDDIVHASDRGDNVFGGGGNDTLYGGRLDDWLLGGEGADTLHAGSAAGALGGDGNYLDGGAGDDALYGREGSDWLEGGEGADLLDGGDGDDILAGGGGADLEKGGHGDDQYLVRIGDGADIADETGGGTILGAPAAVDAVQARYAGIAAGTIAKNWRGTGHDLALAEEANAAPGAIGTTYAASSAGGEDAIVFGAGIGLGDIRLSRTGTSGADLLIEVMATDAETGIETPTGTQLVVKDWFADPFKRVEWLKFADGNEIRIGDVTSFVIGTGGSDVLIGTAGKDFVYGGGGNDTIFLREGDDIGNGGTGSDIVWGEEGDDLVIGGLGADELIGGLGKDALSGDAGNDDLYGGGGADILSGGRGDDQMVGGAGNDVFKYSRGDGRDTIFDEFSAHWTAIWTAAGWAAGYSRNDTTGEVTAPDGSLIYRNMGTNDAPDLQWIGRYDYNYSTGTLYRYDAAAAGQAGVVDAGDDTIEFGLGIDIQDIVLTRTSPASNDLILTISRENDDLPSYAAATDSITIKNYYSVADQIETFAFYQTGAMRIGTGGLNIVAGTDALNILAGTGAADWISGGAGDDIVSANDGNDILSGNSGFDTLKGQGGEDVLYGGSGNDTLDGGAGADILIGGSGMDTASYAASSAIVRAYLGASWANAGTEAAGDTYYGVENLIGGTYGSGMPSPGSADVLGGDDGDNELTGGRGDDLLMGGAGDDSYMWNGADWADMVREGAFTVEEAVTLAGTLKDGYVVTHWQQTDVLQPGYSNRYYWRLQVTRVGEPGVSDDEIVYDWAQFAPSQSVPAEPAPAAWDTRGWLGGFVRTNLQQVVREKFDTSIDGGHDTIEFGAGISLSDLAFERYGPNGRDDAAGPDLLIRYGTGTFDYMLIKDQFTTYGKIESLLFRDGLSVSLSSIVIANIQSATTCDDLLSGQVGIVNEHLIGGEGDDVLNGLRGVDWLEGGNGDDVLEGGSGNYADTLDGGGNSEAPTANSGPEAKVGWGDTVRYVRSSAINVDLRRTTAQIGGDAAGDILIDIENVVGSYLGADTISGHDGANRLDGLDGNNVIHGWDGDDVVIAGSGLDSLYGDGGDDAISGADGNDQLWGGDGNDRLNGGTGDDALRGEAGKDVLTGGDGNDGILDGGDGDDQIFGEAGNDTLIGGLGNDLLGGGAGNDVLQGGGGDDDYYFQKGSGVDTLSEAGGTNNIQFGDGISFNQLWLTRVGGDLRIGVIGTADVVTVTGFFAAGPKPIRALQTTSHAAFLDHSAIETLITAMTTISESATPTAMPGDIAALLPTYWHAGGKAAPVAPAVRELTTPEDELLEIDGSYGVVDQDSNIASYSMKAGGGPAHGMVTFINAATGALEYTPAPNFSGTDEFSIIAVDADGQSAVIPIRVTVGALNDQPAGLRTASGAGLAVFEAAPGSLTGVGTAVGQLAATDPEGDLLSWSLLEDDGGRFAITVDGLVYVNEPTLIDREPGRIHEILVRATDALGAVTDQTFAIDVLDVNEANNLAVIEPLAVREDVGIGVVVGTLPPATDIDSGVFGLQRYYFWHDGSVHPTSWDSRFAMDAATGEISVAGALDYEGGTPSRTYSVVARDNGGAAGFKEAPSSITIVIGDANEANELGIVAPMAVDEDLPSGTVVGTIAAVDPDGGLFGEQRYFFLDGMLAGAISSDQRYLIDPVTGTITTNQRLDHETMGTGSYVVAARDNQGGVVHNQDSASLMIGIVNVNERPDTPLPGNVPSMAAESSSGWVAPFSLSDPDGPAPSLHLTSNPGGRFVIVGAEVRFAGGTAPDFETLYATLVAQGISAVDSDNDGLWEFSLTGSVAATDGALSSIGSADFTVKVEDVNEAPSAIVFTPADQPVLERDRILAGSDSLPPIDVGTLSVTDADLAGFASGSYSLSVSDDRFEIVGTTLRLKQGSVLDFEAGPFSVEITARDHANPPLCIHRTIDIVIGNRDDILEGNAAGNSLFGQQNRDLLYGYAGNDWLDGGNGDDDLYGGAGKDILFGGIGSDRLYGEDGVDLLVGGAGNDLLEGGANEAGYADNLFGEGGNDTLLGGAGNDDLFGGEGADVLDGGEDIDTANYRALTLTEVAYGAVIVDLLTPSANTGAALGDTYVNIENIVGSQGSDDLRGDAQANQIEGWDGNDSLQGRGGADILFGGQGSDVLWGGAGNDRLYGGEGDDQLFAESGDDYLDGGAGNDVLNGGLDNDSYIVSRSSGSDTINNYDPSGDDLDVLGFQDAILIENKDLWFERSLDDMRISVVGTNSSVLIKDWYLISDANSRANFALDFIIADIHYSTTINAEGLVALMATKAKPATIAARNELMADAAYLANWSAYWGLNVKPVISVINAQTTNEDVSHPVTVTATGYVTPNASLTLTARVVSQTPTVAGASVISNWEFSASNPLGERTLTISPVGQSSGTAVMEVTATDAGGLSESREFTITIVGVADAPTVNQFSATPGTSGQAGGIVLSLNIDFPDMDGSEVHAIAIDGVPATVSLSAGTYDSAAGLWRLTPEQLVNLKLYAPAGWSQDLTLTAIASATENGGTATSASATTIVVINAPPTGATLSGSGSVLENAANASFVGNVVGADPDGGALTYSLTNDAGGRFSLTAAGALTVANGSLFNYEAATSHMITVRVTDPFNQFVDQLLTVAVSDANEQNVLPVSHTYAVNENAAIGTEVTTAATRIAASDPDSAGVSFGQQRYYFWNGTSATPTSSDGRYAINSLTGAITVAAALNYEIGTPSGSYTVIARDNQGNAPFKEASTNVLIGVVDVNEQNSLPATHSYAVNENAVVGTEVTTAGTRIAASDPDFAGAAFGQQRYYFWDGANAISASSDGRYAINILTGAITVATPLDFEIGAPSASYTVIARDNQGLAGYKEASSSVTIGIVNLNEANGLAAIPAMAVDENIAVGAFVGTVPAASDPDGGGGAFGQQRYYFWDGASATSASPDGRYAINILTGAITTAALLDYEGESPIGTYAVVARDNQGLAGYNQASSSFTVGITNLNEPNALGAIPAMAIDENVAVGAVVGTVPAATDPDGSAAAFGQQRYSFWNGSAALGVSWDGRYAINALTGQITTVIALDFEAGSPNGSYTVVARDNQGAGGHNQAFSSVAIGISNLNEANALGVIPAMAVSENAAAGTAVGTVPAATDPDGNGVGFGQQRYYFWTGAAAIATSPDGRYAIDAVTGQITTVISLDYEGGSPSATYSIVARDNPGGAGNQASSSVVIGIQDVNEPHSLQAASFTVNESNNPLGLLTPVPTTAGAIIDIASAMLQDPEGRGMHWQFSNGSTQLGPWQLEQDGTLRMIQGVDYESLVEVWEYQPIYDEQTGYYYDNYVYLGRDPSRAIFNVTVRAVDPISNLPQEATLTINIADVNEGPTASSFILDYSSSYRYGLAPTDYNIPNDYWVYYDTNEGAVVQVTPYDPERVSSGYSYSISNLETSSIHVEGSSNGDIDGGYPTLSIGADGKISFFVDGDNQWDGGTYVGVRLSQTIIYSFLVNITDSSGVSASTPFKLTFIHRNHTQPPIIFDLDGDGLELVAYDGSSINFDMDADGIRDRTGWVAADDGLLALDRNGDGKIGDISEISFISDLQGAVSDLEGLRAFDTNANGFLDAGDQRFAEFRIWRDANQDGVSDAGELLSLPQAGVVSVSLSMNLTGNQPGGSDNVIYATTEYLATDGSSKIVGDVFFAFDPSNVANMAPPIVLDYDGDGSGLVSIRDSAARFDMDGDGDVQKAGWIASGDAFLVLDRNGDGAINDITEISFVADRLGARTDLEGLTGFDSNGDGILSSQDLRFNEFQLWFDDGDGVSAPSELRTLAEAGISEIDLNGESVPASERQGGGNIVQATASFTRNDGSVGTLLDVALAYASSSSDSGLAWSGWGGSPAPSISLSTPDASSAMGGAAVPPLVETQPQQPGLPEGLAERLKALQSRLDRSDGRKWGLERLMRHPNDVNLFDMFTPSGGQANVAPDALSTRADRPGEQLAVADGQAASALLTADTRLAQMIQQMASFGGASGEADWKERGNAVHERYDYFAA